MTAPIEEAYGALAASLGAALAGAGFLPTSDGLAVDPPAATEAFDDDGGDLPAQTTAQLFKLETKPVRAFLGSGAPRWAVERTARLELAGLGADEARWRAQLVAATTVAAQLAASDPTLSGSAERLDLLSYEADDLPPNGEKALITYVLRVRSGDPLGLTP